MYPGTHAVERPDQPAVIMGSGEVVTYRQLDANSNRCAQLLRSRGLGPGSAIGVWMKNCAAYYDPCWAAQRSGLYYTPISTHLTPDEVEYIARDCAAEVMFVSAEYGELARSLRERLPRVRAWFAVGGEIPGCERYESAVVAEPAVPVPDELEGQDMLYSSGTTGKPKGIRVPLSGRKPGEPDPMALGFRQSFWGLSERDVYLSPAPLYHSAPLRCTIAAQRLGATCVVMERFDPEQALALIERHRVTTSQWVPTMFVRMLKLPLEVRKRYDLSSHRIAVHAAAPCPVPVKQQMIEWWGPILFEYYSATENNGSTAISAQEWLAHPGSVGKPFGVRVHVLDDEGRELPLGEPGAIYFEGGGRFEYHGDAEKTRGSYSVEGWSTVGDIGYLDAEGYLYLTDRKSHMIISGGVNIYPQEAENLLVTHPAVADVAVIGVPHPEFGEEVKAVVELVEPERAGPEVAAELIAFCEQHLSKLKCPRSVDFAAKLPRAENGKLYKRRLRDRYWQGHETRIV
jgi:acyl-CoA synthetase (AMP-forming)/AMP-acid ligase II